MHACADRALLRPAKRARYHGLPARGDGDLLHLPETSGPVAHLLVLPEERYRYGPVSFPTHYWLG